MHNEQQRLKYHGERVKSRRIHQSRSIRLENRPRHREEEENHGYVRNEGKKKHPADSIIIGQEERARVTN